jgi:hypothetical protein
MANKRPGKPRATKNGAGRLQESGPRAAYFLSLSLENVRCFGEKQTLDLSNGHGRPARWTLLLGDNGTGKTTVLQSLADALRAFRETGWHIGMEKVVRGESRLAYLEVEVAIGPGLGASVKQYAKDTIPIGYEKEHGAETLHFDGTPHPEWVTCFGYGASRRMGAGSLNSSGSNIGTESLFSYYADLRNAEEWLLRLDYDVLKWKNQRQAARLDQVKRLLLAVLPETDDIRMETSGGVYPTARVEFRTPYGWVPLRQLGFGYQTLIAWVVDFVSRLVERYPDSDDPLAEPAVVLVDEIDLHLHPKWQRRLIGDLTQHFPNTQFVATAHSPLVVQAAADANLAVLRREEDHVVIDQTAGAIRGWRVDQVLTSDLFGLPTARPPQFDADLKRRTELLSQARLTAAQKRELAEIEARIGDLPAGETAEEAGTLRLLKDSLELLKKHQKTAP